MRSRQYPPDNNTKYTKECQLSDILKSLGESDVVPNTRKSLSEKKEELKKLRVAKAAAAAPAPTSTEEAAQTRKAQREKLKQLRMDAKAASPASTSTEEAAEAAAPPSV